MEFFSGAGYKNKTFTANKENIGSIIKGEIITHVLNVIVYPLIIKGFYLITITFGGSSFEY